MNRALPEMLNCLNTPGNFTDGNSTDSTVLERQRARLKWLQQEQLQQQHSYFSGSEINGLFTVPGQVGQVQGFEGLVGNSESVFAESMNRSVKVDPDLGNGWPELGKFEMPNIRFGDSGLVNGTGFQFINGSIPRTISCPPVVAAGHEPSNHSQAPLPEKLCSASGREACKKRRAEKSQSSKIVSEDETREKRIKGSAEEGESKITEQSSTKNNNRETSDDTSKENSKVSEVQKLDYIHVRARRGQATDSHSLAERVRRGKISERMKYLQDLVPGCNKITSKAGMLDEIINYVQSLQRQVEFLSMKLATVNPRLDFNIDDFLVKEMFPACNTSFQSDGMPSEMTNSAYLQFNPVQQLVSCSTGSEIGVSYVDAGLRGTISAPVIPETFLDTSCFSQLQHPGTWDSDLQNLFNEEFNQGRPSSSFQFQQFIAGLVEAGILKMKI